MPGRQHFRCALLLAILVIPGILRGNLALAAVYEVSPAGADNNTGSPGQPFQTISHAAGLASAGDTVIINPGIYREAVGLMRSGMPGHPIVFMAKTPGTAIITGADPLRKCSPIPNHPGQYVCDWPYDFVIDTRSDGTKVRDHGAPPPVGCAEQLLWESHRLLQVMKEEDLAPGCFFADWKLHQLKLQLPGNADPSTTEVEGGVRKYLFSPLETNNKFADARFITVRGLIFRNAANFAQRGGVILGSNWTMQDCTVEFNNAGGMMLQGNDINLLGVTSRFNGFGGIGGTGNNITLDRCVVYGNNLKGYPADWDGGGGKFTKTHKLRVMNHISHDNTGPGLWLDFENTDYSITDSTFYGNHGLAHDWEGSGITIEISGGPGTISGNTIYSNTGAGILLAESLQVNVDHNTFAGNESGIELRSMEGRGTYRIEKDTIANNRFKDWRSGAIVTSLGKWDFNSLGDRGLIIGPNLFDPAASASNHPLLEWGGQSIPDLASAASHGFEKNGQIGHFSTSTANFINRTISDPLRINLATALAGAKPGSEITLPLNGRSPRHQDKTWAAVDLENHWIILECPDPAIASKFEKTVITGLDCEPVMVRVRLVQNNPESTPRAVILDVAKPMASTTTVP